MRALIEIDFAQPTRRVSWLGALLLGLGAVAAAVVGLEYRAVQARRAAVELRLTAVALAAQRSTRLPLEPLLEGRGQTAVRELSTPWTALLAELESASQDSASQVALLGVEPDHAKHSVHIIGEARNLGLALAYVQRLQRSSALRYPMLESHQVQAEDPEHPVRFELTSEWRDAL